MRIQEIYDLVPEDQDVAVLTSLKSDGTFMVNVWSDKRCSRTTIEFPFSDVFEENERVANLILTFVPEMVKMVMNADDPRWSQFSDSKTSVIKKGDRQIEMLGYLW